MKVVIDIECNGLENPTKVWLIVCKDIDTGKFYVWRDVSNDEKERESFTRFHETVSLYIGHNFLGYDWPNLSNLLGIRHDDICSVACDTLVISKLADYSRANGHSLEAYGSEFGLDKLVFKDFSKYSKEMEEYCVRDVEIGERVYRHLARFHSNPSNRSAIETEQRFQIIVNSLHNTGFAINLDKCRILRDKVEKELAEIDIEIQKVFPPREVLIREFTPKATKFGTISKTSVPKSLRYKIQEYEIGKTYRHTRLEPFNPDSHKQRIDVLTEAGWKPTSKTKTHLDTELELNRLRYKRNREPEVDLRIDILHTKMVSLSRYGWKLDEENLSTLPPSAPSPARALAKRIMLEARRRTLTEWINLVQEDGRIHGRFYGIGAWTHRMAHQNPNTANIPNEYDTSGKKKLYGKEMRELWIAPKRRLLVGVDAEGIQLRVFAHYVNDPQLTKSLVEGRKDDKTDPHSLNQRILGPVCKSRAAAKRFLYALFLGAGIGKLAEILGSSKDEAKGALDHLMVQYVGWKHLKEHIIPADAKRGWFLGLDGRPVKIPAEDLGTRKHLLMSGYLQNGEAIIMKRATLKWHHKLVDFNSNLVNMVHDEWQTETPNDVAQAIRVAEIQSSSLKEVGEELGLLCPLAGSYWNDDLKDYTIGTNWSVTH